ncbi:MAG TPA: UDP-N-acetylglucosamine 2-epimerase (non-hydrolyzing) [Verrucomicrobiae bacterium]|nr:UDP-N-acetylglucosamine 2-epimerase (non-hydrolyzing) [Verrucomicrobiae bacterium]
MSNKVLFVFGTRPEAIKMAPLIKHMERAGTFEVKVCVTGQHRKMLDQVLSFFDIKPDFDLQLMKANQTLADITADVIRGVDALVKNEFTPHYIVVQGDTTTAMAGAMAAFYSKIKVIHIEAGLRSHEKYSPFPEEINRMLVGKMADFHFAPTEKAVENLLAEGVAANAVWNVGNTVIDALFLGLDMIRQQDTGVYEAYFEFIDRSKRIILVTGHRRENFGAPFENMCRALRTIADRNPDVEIVYPVHLNPNVREPVERILGNHSRIHLIEPLDYAHLIWLLNLCTLVITDSGGIQEEAPALGKPVLVMREVTERMEGVAAGTAKLVGTDYDTIVSECEVLLTDSARYEEMARAVNPYGDGTTSQQIVAILKEIVAPLKAPVC